MEVSRITFTKETKEKMNKKLNHFQRGELRWKKIRELEASGKLKMARSRKEVVNMLGDMGRPETVYTWVSNMINRGHLKETITGIGGDGLMEHEYSIVREPSFDLTARIAKARKTRNQNNTKQNNTKQNDTPYAEPIDEPTVINRASFDDNKAKIVIKYNDLSISIENVDRSTVESIVEKIAVMSKRQ